MKEKEKLFCRYFTDMRNLKEAALSAGYKISPEKTAQKLLSRKDICEEISRLSGKNSAQLGEVTAGLKRLAFGSVSDAVKLMLVENPGDIDLDGLNLFNVSDIKKPKGGGIEIKFFDRQKALEKLMEISQAADTSGAGSFLTALERGAAALGGDTQFEQED